MQVLTTIAAVLVGVMAVARLTRLATQDSFPPAAKIRAWWEDLTENTGWDALAYCHWCLAPWLTIPILLWGWLTDLQTAWWVFNGWLAASYAASMIVERDEKD